MKATWLDRAVSFVDPQAGLRRIRARAAADAMLRYDGAARGRRTAGWSTTGTSANAEIGPDLTFLRNRSRDVIRNNPLLKKAHRVRVANTVGNKPEADTGDKNLNAAIDKAFAIWSKECDADGQLDWGGIERLIESTIEQSGEVVVRDRYRKPEDGFFVPYQVQVLEPDYIDSNRQWWPNDNTGPTIAGVSFDVLGSRTGYWIFPWHPGDVVKNVKDGFVSKLISADLITHIYEKERPGQVRGVPWFAAVLQSSHDLDGYEDALRVCKRIQACTAIFVEQAEGSDGPAMGQTSTDQNGNRVETMEPGMVEYLKPGEKVNFAQPTQTTDGSFITGEQHKLAAGSRVMYEQMTGDLSLVNYSSFRAGHIEFRVDVEEYRDTTLIPMGLQRIWNKFIDAAFVAGKIPAKDYGCRWTAKPWQSVDPEKDATANLLEVRSGRKTWPQSVVEAGLDPKRQLQQIIDTNAMFDAAEVVLDIDPRKVDRNRGAAQIKVTDDINGPQGAPKK